MIAGAALPLLGAAPPAEVGRWLTQNELSVIDVVPCAAGLCGRIVGISRDHPTDPQPRDIWGGYQCHESIIHMTSQGGDGRWRGSILDPRSGRTWRAEIWGSGEALRLRGYIGLPLFGATQVWSRYGGHLSAACDFDHPAVKP